jgi:O-antigen/teichoic acid export membrane protein
VLAPSVANLYAMDKRIELQRLLTKSARIIALVCVPPLLAVMLLGEHVLTIFGSKFTAAAPTLAILCAGQIINATTGNTGILMNMTGHERETLTTMVVAVAFSILVGLLLIPVLGALGAATSASLSLAGRNIWLTYRAIKLLGVDPSILGVNKK